MSTIGSTVGHTDIQLTFCFSLGSSPSIRQWPTVDEVMRRWLALKDFGTVSRRAVWDPRGFTVESGATWGVKDSPQRQESKRVWRESGLEPNEMFDLKINGTQLGNSTGFSLGISFDLLHSCQCENHVAGGTEGFPSRTLINELKPSGNPSRNPHTDALPPAAHPFTHVTAVIRTVGDWRRYRSDPWNDPSSFIWSLI